MEQDPPEEKGAPRQKMGSFFSTAIKSISLILVAGFLIFTLLVKLNYTDISHHLTARADGIVVLTGGKHRIKESIRLLAEKKGTRLLISGVNRTISRDQLAKSFKQYHALFSCCIDTDYIAENTIQNAQQTRKWAEAKNFRSLIIVTSNYHMPRSMLELQRLMPEMKLIPYPVVQKSFHIDLWWAYPGTLKLLLSEYIKFIPAIARHGIASAFALGPPKQGTYANGAGR